MQPAALVEGMNDRSVSPLTDAMVWTSGMKSADLCFFVVVVVLRGAGVKTVKLLLQLHAFTQCTAAVYHSNICTDRAEQETVFV